MKFLSFNSRSERERFGGSSIIEIQFCKLNEATNLEQIVAVSGIKHWKNDSLYIRADDMNQFYYEYNNIFDSGTYANSENGKVDLCGINYYKKNTVDSIIAKIQKAKPSDYDTLLMWLSKVKQYNGFYILGI